MEKKSRKAILGKVGVLISNVGTPEGTGSKAIRKYLHEFLMDPYVIQIPKLIRILLVRTIVSVRWKKTAAKYQKIWTEKGSPLLVETKKMTLALGEKLGSDYKVTMAMCYGEPGFSQAKQKLRDCERVIFFPQYPQYAQSTVQSSLDCFYRHFSQKTSRVIDPYFMDDEFIKAYGRFLRSKFETIEFDHLLMSFHGLPVSHIQKTDPTAKHCLTEHCCKQAPSEVIKSCYKAQCLYSAQALAKILGLGEKQYSVSFQSRVGFQKWIGPYTEDLYNHLVEKGVQKLAVICPGFSVDCLETLEEIAIEGKRIFLQKGGQEFHFISCLNDSKHWIEACAKMVKKVQF